MNGMGEVKSQQTGDRRGLLASRGFWLSLTLLVVGLAATYQAARYVQGGVDREQARDFNFGCQEVELRIKERLRSCEAILRSGAAFVAHTPAGVGRMEWHRFIEEQSLWQHFPGIQGVGYAQAIGREELPAHVERVRGEGFPFYQIRPGGERERYSSIIYLEPFTDRNLRAFGYDMLTESTRRAAMERARDRNEPALSGKVVLVQETDRDVQAGTLMYVPVYRLDLPATTVEERRVALIGWVYSPYRMGDLMAGTMLNRDRDDGRGLRLEIFDGEEMKPDQLLFDSAPAWRPGVGKTWTAVRTITSAGHDWHLRFSAGSPGGSGWANGRVVVVTVSGISISLLLAGLMFSLHHTQRRAESLAELLTKQVRANGEKFRAIADYTVNWETWFGPDGRVQWVNPGVERLTGYTAAEVLAMPDPAETMIAPADREAFRALAQGRLPEERGEDREFQCFRKDGTAFWLSVSWQPIFADDGAALGVRTSGRDISQLKQSEAKLNRANWVLEQANTTIVITNSRGVIEYVNAEFTRATGYTREEAIGRNPRFLQSGHTSRSTYEELWRELTAGRNWSGEFQNRRKNGEILWETVAISPLRDESGRITHYVGIKQDVTEHRRLQAALHESLVNFRAFFESITDMIFVCDHAGKIIFTNQSVARTLGYAPAELEKMRMLDVHPADRRAEAELIFAAMVRGERASCPLPLAAQDGTLVPVETRIWFGQWNGANCIFGIAKNLSAEQEAQERFERLFRRNPLLMALSTLPDRQIADINDSFLRVLGFSREEVLGRTAVDLQLFPQLRQLEEIAEVVQREGRVANVEVVVRRRDGSTMSGLLSGEVIQGQGRRFFLTVLSDISELKRTQEALASSNDRLFLAARAGGVGIWDYDIAHDRIVWDDQMFRLYGVERETFGGGYEAWRSAVHPEDRDRADQDIQRALRGEKSFDTQFRVVRPDGSVHDIHALALVQRDASGQPQRMIGTNWDITAEKRRAAETAAMLEKERQVSEMKTRFISVTSHEFRTPMAAALGSAELLHHHYAELTPVKREELFGRISFSLRRMTEMLDEILLLNRMDAKRVEVHPEPVEIGAFVRNLVEEVRLGDRQGHRFATDLPGSPIQLLTDPILLHQILGNLLSNAVRYSAAGTEITVGVREDDGRIHFAVRDHGIGVLPQDRARIFEPFERGANVGVIKGTGLGLNIVKRMAEMLGGSVALEIPDGGGSRFVVSLPDTPPPPA